MNMSSSSAASDLNSDSQPVAAVTDTAQIAVMPSARLKICLLGYRSAPYGGGQGIYIKYLSKALVDAGHEVDVVSGQPYPHVDPRVKLIKMPSMNLYENGLDSIRPRHLTSLTNLMEWCGKLTGGFSEPYCFGRRANKYLKKHGHQYDLVHDNQCLSYGMLNIQARQPFVTTLHHPITSDLQIALDACEKWWERILIRRWHAFLAMQAEVVQKLDHIVTVSHCSKQDIASAFNIEAETINLVYNGIDTEEFRPMPQIQRNPMRIMATASADAPLKGLRYLIEAYAQLLPKYPELELLVVGKPKVGGDTEALLKRLGVEHKIQFVSGISTEQMVAYYAEAAMAVVPSMYEGFGLPAGEAMACEVPVISSDGGALPEVVGEHGIIVPKGDSAAIAQAIEQLLADPDKAAEMGRLGRQRIVAKFCWKVAAGEMTQYYQSVLAHHANS